MAADIWSEGSLCWTLSLSHTVLLAELDMEGRFYFFYLELHPYVVLYNLSRLPPPSCFLYEWISPTALSRAAGEFFM